MTVLTTYQDAPTKTVDIGGAKFAYRELGPDTGTPVIFLNHLAAVLDNWDVDGIAARHHVITFGNRGVGASQGKTPGAVTAMARDAIAFIRRSRVACATAHRRRYVGANAGACRAAPPGAARHGLWVSRRPGARPRPRRLCLLVDEAGVITEVPLDLVETDLGDGLPEPRHARLESRPVDGLRELRPGRAQVSHRR